MLKRLLVLATTAVVCLAIAPTSAHATASSSRVSGCASLNAMHVRCIQAGPLFRTYVVLPNVGAGSNFSEYTAGGASPGTSVITRYDAIRIDPIPVRRNPLTFLVDIADQTFSSSTGMLCHGSSDVPCPEGQQVTSMPYGVAMDCMGGDSASGMANIDLRGTPFALADTFSTQGFQPGGGATFVTRRVVNLTGGGFCGWNAPAATYNPYNTNPMNDANGGWDLQLTVSF
jgi:hypothetical protein